MLITISWDLTAAQVASLDALVDTFNTEAKAAYDARVTRATIEGFDPGPVPTVETRDSFVSRLGLKSLRGNLEVQEAQLRQKNIRKTLDAFDAAAETEKIAALGVLGLSLVNGVVSPKV